MKFHSNLNNISESSSGKSQFINREMEKLNNNRDRREKFKSSKEVPGYKRLPQEKKDKDIRTYAQTRYSNKRPFDYMQSNASEKNDAKSKKSEERKINSIVGKPSIRNKGRRQAFDSMDYRASKSPSDVSEGVQVTAFNEVDEEEARRSYISDAAQVGKSLENPYTEQKFTFKDEGIQAEEPWKDEDIQWDMSENNEGIQVDMDMEMVSRGISAGSDSNGNPLMTREVEIVDKESDGSTQNDNRIDFSCQFSYHTIASTDNIKEEGKNMSIKKI